MKKMLCLLGLLMLGVAVTKAQVVGTDRELDANLQNFKSYSWSKDIDNIPGDAVFVGPNGVTVFNNESTRNHIKEAVQYELDARGYQRVAGNPDFLVSFIVLENPAELTTYDGYRLIHNGLDTVRTPENVERIAVKEGTVLINFIDFKTGKAVWQGYASGILQPDMMNDQSKVRSAISSIFQQYKHKAFAKE